VCPADQFTRRIYAPDRVSARPGSSRGGSVRL